MLKFAFAKAKRSLEVERKNVLKIYTFTEFKLQYFVIFPGLAGVVPCPT
jgi:hypothetical protein